MIDPKSNLSQLRALRLEKVEKLRKLGINPYPARSNRSTNISEPVNNFPGFENKEVVLTGRLMSWREHGQLIFGDIKDQSGKIQLYIRSDTLQTISKENQTLGYSDLGLLDIGDFVELPNNHKTQRVKYLYCKNSKTLTKSIRPLPDKWKGITVKEQRYRRRYLDLTMNNDVKDLFLRKAKFWELSRKFMQENGFLEVETPVLEHKTGGADARPFVTHHHDLDLDLYMRISTELYLKRLIGGGYEKIYTLGPNFRNEGVDDEHLQEYYQLEWYWAYQDYRANMAFVQKLFQYIAANLYDKHNLHHGERHLTCRIGLKLIM
jgi:lysyl-tRNA synthetase class 2